MINFDYDEMSTAELVDDRLSEIRQRPRDCEDLKAELFKVRDYGRRAELAREARHQAVMNELPISEWPSRRLAGALKGQRTRAWNRAVELEFSIEPRGFIESHYGDQTAVDEVDRYAKRLAKTYELLADKLIR
jgi:hypothetical protein